MKKEMNRGGKEKMYNSMWVSKKKEPDQGSQWENRSSKTKRKVKKEMNAMCISQI